mgnify:CR=1 FL=1
MKNAVKTARYLAWFTIGYNIVEGLVSVAFGLKDESLSLFGFGMDSFIEVFSAVIILWRLRREFGGGAGSLERERLATRGIGVLFLLSELRVANFGRTWPIILLVIGAVKLLQSSAMGPGSGNPSGPGAGPASGGGTAMPPAPPSEVNRG